MPTWSWAQPWRIRRIHGRLKSMGKPSKEQFMSLQNDEFSSRAAHVLKTLLNCQFPDPRAEKLAGILRNWDGYCGKHSRACLVFNWLPTQISEILLRGLLEDDLELYYTILPFFTSLLESITRDVKVLELFPDSNGEIHTLESLMEKALIGIWEGLSGRFGGNPRRWKWGRYHKLHYRHPGGEGKIKSWLLNRGPWPAGGDWTTVNVSGFSLSADPGEVTTIPSMRFIASLADKNDNILCLPLGQSGRPGNRFYDNFTTKFRSGSYVPFPMEPQGRAGRAGGVLLLKKG